ncbi:MAG: hypothetical protein AAF449_16230 [Myxococcota bacterium]
MMNITQTETATVGLDTIIGALPTIITAFQNGGFWAGLVAVFGTLALILNYGPLKKWLAQSHWDWARPAIMLVGVAIGAGVAAATAGADLLAAIIAGVVTGVSSGYIQNLIQDIKD